MADRLTALELADALADGADFGAGEEPRMAQARRALGSELFREFWKYTPPADYLAGLEGLAPTQAAVAQSDIAGITLRSASAGERAAMGDPESPERFPLADLAVLLAGDLLVLEVTETPEAPVVIRQPGGFSIPMEIRVAAGVELTLIEHQDMPGSAYQNQSLYLHLAEGARVSHSAAALDGSCSHWSLTQAHLAADAHYERRQYQLGGRRRRTETQVLLNGRGATANITGAYVVEAGQHLDQQLVVEHRAGHTRSEQRFHGIGAGKGTAVFNGRIHIHAGAPGADAALSNRNLALHPEAIINTKPELEIYTDDVRCSHGATVGQLSEESLFYLQSRGIARPEARRLICRAFIESCIAGPLAEAAEDALLGTWASAS
ncbi:MAG: Fe-S cluster assembly protein SufD [Pseudomonadota bacterium]